MEWVGRGGGGWKRTDGMRTQSRAKWEGAEQGGSSLWRHMQDRQGERGTEFVG